MQLSLHYKGVLRVYVLKFMVVYEFYLASFGGMFITLLWLNQK